MPENPAQNPAPGPLPLSVITGFLGSGKTTLLNALLRNPEFKNTAIIINEFGDVSIDHLLVETADEGIIELSDGCLCCTIRGDLVDTLTQLLRRIDEDTNTQIDRIIVETTGLADPAPILHVIMAHPQLLDRVRLDGVITLVDAVNANITLDNNEEAVKQVAMADRIVLSKCDLQADKEALNQLHQRISRLNPAAPIIEVLEGNVDPDLLFNCGLYDPASKSVNVGRWLRQQEIEQARNGPDNGHHHHHDVNRHDSAIRAFTLVHDKPIDAVALQSFLDLLRSAHGPQLLRLKGIVQITEHPDKPVVIHAVQHVFHPPATLQQWPDEDHRSRLVVITRDLSEKFVQRLFDAFTGTIAPDTPDRQALDQNPLAVPGFTPNRSSYFF